MLWVGASLLAAGLITFAWLIVAICGPLFRACREEYRRAWFAHEASHEAPGDWPNIPTIDVPVFHEGESAR